MAKSAREIEADLRQQLGLCSLEARGLWCTMRYVIDESDTPGHLRQNSKPMSVSQLARVAGCDSAKASSLLAELKEAGLMFGSAGRDLHSPYLVRVHHARESNAARQRRFAERNPEGALSNVFSHRNARKSEGVAQDDSEAGGLANASANALSARQIGRGVSPAPSSLPVPLSLSPPTSPILFPPGEEKAAEARKSRAKSDSPHAELIRFFIEKWQEKYGKPYPFRKVDGVKMAELLTACGGSMEDAKAVLLRYLACDDGFLNGHALPMLLSGSLLPKFLVEPANRKVNHHGHTQNPSAANSAAGSFAGARRPIPQVVAK